MARSDRKVIGITLGIKKNNESMWVNGIKMNAIFLFKALKLAGHTVYLLDTSKNVDRNKITGKLDGSKLSWDANEYPCYDFFKKQKDCDMLVLLGTAIGPDLVNDFKALGGNRRVIKYACGNNYVIDMETMIHIPVEEANKMGTTYNRNIDEVWYVPQQGYQNHEYYRVTHDLPADKVKPVPFVWDPMFIDGSDSFYKITVDEDGNEVPGASTVPIYRPGKKPEDLKLCVFEPNLNVVKFSMIPTLIADDYLGKGGQFDQLHIVSAARLYKNMYWRKFISGIRVGGKNSKDQPYIQVQHRFPVHVLLSKFTDIVISHQWENPLNYAYLDCMYLQFPLIHNADMIKDAGYYYPDFEIGKGSDLLKWVIENHDKNIDEYNEKNEEVMTRYTVYNEGLVETYGKLIDNLFAGENKHGLSLKYNWKTNLYYE